MGAVVLAGSVDSAGALLLVSVFTTPASSPATVDDAALSTSSGVSVQTCQNGDSRSGISTSCPTFRFSDRCQALLLLACKVCDFFVNLLARIADLLRDGVFVF
jgi:hypothetical protein